MTSVVEVGKRETPPHAIDVVAVAWVDPLQSELLLPAYRPGEHVHGLQRILDRIRHMATITRLAATTQTDRIVGQWVLPILGLRRPVIPVPGSQLLRRS